MNDVMLQLGNFQFRAPESAYQKITRTSQYIWTSIQRLGQSPVRQFTGKDQRANISGYILPQLGSGLESMTMLRIIADQGEPQQLVDGHGKNHGYWCITSIQEDRSIYAKKGVPRRIDFNVEISFFGVTDGN